MVKENENDFPCALISPLNLPSSDPGAPEVTVCKMSSLFIHVTFVPAAIFRGVGSNLNILTLTDEPFAAGVDEPDADAFDPAGDALDVEPPPHAAVRTTAAETKTAIINGRKRCRGARKLVT